MLLKRINRLKWKLTVIQLLKTILLDVRNSAAELRMLTNQLATNGSLI